MTPVIKAVLSLAALCLTVAVGVSSAHNSRALRHYYRFLYAGRNEMYDEALEEYKYLPAKLREDHLASSYYNDAKEQAGRDVKPRLFPTMEKADVMALAIFAFGVMILLLLVSPKEQKLYSREKTELLHNPPTDGQLSFIRRINGGVVPVGLTRESAAIMIKNHIAKVSQSSRRQKIDVSPIEFMSGSRSYRERMRLERERKRAQEKLIRQQEQEKRRQEREAQKAQRAADRLYDKRLLEEEKLIKAREGAASGVSRKSRNAKLQAIQELQNLVNDILTDKRIEPQEVRQLKAWLIANRQSPGDFAPMFKLIDESLVDGIIDADETQAIYEGVIDCLITLRERKN